MKKLLLTFRITAIKLMERKKKAAENVLSLSKNIANVSLVIKIDVT